MDQKNTEKNVIEFERKGQEKIKRKERAIVTVSAVFILTALTVTGMYINNQMAQQNSITENAEDLSGGIMQTPELEKVEDLQSVDSGTVENPGITKNTIVAEDIKVPASPSSNTWKGEKVTELIIEEEELLAEQLLEEAALLSEVQNSMISFSGMNMLWPVAEENEVIIPYSMDKAVYFKSLDQYKYSPAMVIAAEAGTPVVAVSAGRISDRYWDYETGWTYEMDLGGGFKAYYGQLDNLEKEVDTYVAAGDVLGYVTSPTKYYMEEGYNLYFAMTKDGKPVYPRDYMGE